MINKISLLINDRKKGKLQQKSIHCKNKIFLSLKEQDRSRRCKYIQSNMTFSVFLLFFLQKLLIKSTKYYEIHDQRV